MRSHTGERGEMEGRRWIRVGGCGWDSCLAFLPPPAIGHTAYMRRASRSFARSSNRHPAAVQRMEELGLATLTIAACVVVWLSLRASKAVVSHLLDLARPWPPKYVPMRRVDLTSRPVPFEIAVRALRWALLAGRRSLYIYAALVSSTTTSDECADSFTPTAASQTGSPAVSPGGSSAGSERSSAKASGPPRRPAAAGDRPDPQGPSASMWSYVVRALVDCAFQMAQRSQPMASLSTAMRGVHTQTRSIPWAASIFAVSRGCKRESSGSADRLPGLRRHWHADLPPRPRSRHLGLGSPSRIAVRIPELTVRSAQARGRVRRARL